MATIVINVRAQCHSTANFVRGVPHHLTKNKKQFQCHFKVGTSKDVYAHMYINCLNTFMTHMVHVSFLNTSFFTVEQTLEKCIVFVK